MLEFVDDYYDLGSHTFPITTASRSAQRWFDRGVIWRYAFNHEEAVNCFRKAAEHDPDCAMAYWGIAYATGPYYNKPWSDFTQAEIAESLTGAKSAMSSALSLIDRINPVERALIEALAHRYPSGQPGSPEDLEAWEDAYAGAMRTVYKEFSEVSDVAALFAEAMMNRTPWQLWDLESGEPKGGADTLEVAAVLEKALETADNKAVQPHPGILHLQIHVWEMSPHPERALQAADVLRDVAGDAGHFLHMPSHIDILCGDYHAALVANNRAIVADRKYVEREGVFNFYTLSRCHDYHFKIYAAMFLGQFRPAYDAAAEMIATIPETLLRRSTPPMDDWIEGFVPMKAHVLVRFGKWAEILAEPLPSDPELYPVTTAIWHYAKGVAHAVLGQLPQADAEQRLFEAAHARVPETRRFFNNAYIEILGIAAEMLSGEIAYRKGDYESAFARLRSAVDRYDSLPYDEPWGWMQPPRHALGALLLEQDRVDEAERVYRADLGLDNTLRRASRHHNNVWSLLGYVECLHRSGKHAEAELAQARLDLALARADDSIMASCFCRTHTQS